jgi:hypothetical protein
LALPPDDPKGQVCVKRLIRTRCHQNHPVKMRPAVFDKAWDRLLDARPPVLKYSG